MPNSHQRKIISAVIVTLGILLAGMPFAAFALPGDGLVTVIELSQSGTGVVEWSTVTAKEGSWSIHLKAPGKAVTNANESRISIKLVPGTKLSDIEFISWWVNTTSGYPPHVDFLLENDTLVAEFAYQPYVGPGYKYVKSRVPYGHYDPSLQASYYNPPYKTWVKTFQNATLEAEAAKVHNDTIFWVLGALAGHGCLLRDSGRFQGWHCRGNR